MAIYADAFELSEDERIQALADMVKDLLTVTMVVEDDEKAEHYLGKLRKTCKFNIVARGEGPVQGTVFVKVGPIGN